MFISFSSCSRMVWSSCNSIPFLAYIQFKQKHQIVVSYVYFMGFSLCCLEIHQNIEEYLITPPCLSRLSFSIISNLSDCRLSGGKCFLLIFMIDFTLLQVPPYYFLCCSVKIFSRSRWFFSETVSNYSFVLNFILLQYIFQSFGTTSFYQAKLKIFI